MFLVLLLVIGLILPGVAVEKKELSNSTSFEPDVVITTQPDSDLPDFIPLEPDVIITPQPDRDLPLFIPLEKGENLI